MLSGDRVNPLDDDVDWRSLVRVHHQGGEDQVGHIRAVAVTKTYVIACRRCVDVWHSTEGIGESDVYIM